MLAKRLPKEVFGRRLGRHGKLWNLNDSLKNVMPLSNVTRSFSSRGASEFKKLTKFKGKYVNLTEVLAGITFRAAATLRLTDRGKLEAGVQADFVIFPTDNYQEITYHQGQLKPSEVWKQGTSVH